MTDLTLKLRLDADGKVLETELRDASGQVQKFGSTAEKSGEQASRGMERAERSSRSLSGGLGKVALAAGGAAAALVSIRTATAGLRQVATNTIVAEQAQAQLEARIVSTGGAAGRTIEQLNANASALQDVSTTGDEVTQSMQAVLLTFTQIEGANFDRATGTILDLATAMSSDLQSAALQVGKSLNDPVLGVSALAEAGIQFSESQKQVIKDLVEMGDTAAAQSIILDELDRQFGGAALAARETFGGSLKGLQNAFGDLLEFRGDLPELTAQIESITSALTDPELAESIQAGLGAGLALIPPLLDTTVTGLTSLLKVGGALAENGDEIVLVAGVLAGVMAGRLAPSIAAVVLAKRAAIAETIRYQVALGAMNGLSSAATVRQLALAGANRTLAASFALVGGPIGIAVAGTAGLAISARNSREEITRSIIPTDNFTAALGRMSEALKLDNAEDVLQVVRTELQTLRAEAEAVADALDRARSLRTDRGAFGISQSLPGAQRSQTEIDAANRLQVINEQIRLAEQLSGEASYDDLTLAIDLLGQAADFAAPLLERLNQSAAGAEAGSRVAAEDIAKFVAPLQQQADGLREQLLLLTGGEQALNEYRDATILNTAAQLDAAAGADQYTIAARQQISQLQALRSSIATRMQAIEAEAAAVAAAEQANADLVATYLAAQAAINPLAADQRELTQQIELFEEALNRSESELAAMGISSDELRMIIAELRAEYEQLGQVDLERPREFLQALEAQLAALRGGPDALREYNLQQQIKNDLEAAGIPITGQLTAEQEAYKDAIEDTRRALQEQIEQQGRVNQLTGIASGTATAILNGSNFNDALGQSLTAFGAEGSLGALEDAVSEALNTAFEKFELSPEAQDNFVGLAQGFSLAAGQALEGNMTQAAFTAAGAVIGSFIPGVGTALGSAIGSLIGGLVGGEAFPKFQITGSNSQLDLGTDETINGALGAIDFSFREIDAQTQTQLRNLVVGFDEQFAAAIEGLSGASRVSTALENFNFSSRRDGESIEALLAERLRVGLGALDQFVSDAVLARTGIEAQFQALADIRGIQDAVDRGNGIGLNVEDTVAIVDELIDPTETIASAFLRLRSGLNGLNTVLGTLGFTVEGSQQDLLRYVDALSQAAGGTQELDRLFNRFWDNFVSEAALATEQAQSARERAAGLLGQLGLDDSLISDPAAFSQQFANLLPTLDPADAALLLQAADAIADVIEAEAALAESRRELVETLAQARESLIRADLSPFQNEIVSIRLEGMNAAAALREQAQAAGAVSQISGGLADVYELTERRIRAAIARLQDVGRDLVGRIFGSELDNLNDRIAQLQSGASGAAGAIGEATRNLIGFADSLLIGELSPLTQGDQLAEAQRQLQAAAASGDSSEVERLSQIVLRIARDRFSSGQDFTDIFNQVQGLLRGFQGQPESIQTVRNPQLEALIRERDALEDQQRDRENAVLARELAQVIADLMGEDRQTLDQVAESLGLNVSELAELLGLDREGFETLLQTLQIDSTEVATNLADLEQTFIDQLSQANSHLTDIADSLRVFRVGSPGESPMPDVPMPPPPEDQGIGPNPLPPIDAQIPRELIEATNGTTGAVVSSGESIVEAIRSSGADNQAMISLLQSIMDELERNGNPSRGTAGIAS